MKCGMITARERLKSKGRKQGPQWAWIDRRSCWVPARGIIKILWLNLIPFLCVEDFVD